MGLITSTNGPRAARGACTGLHEGRTFREELFAGRVVSPSAEKPLKGFHRHRTEKKPVNIKKTPGAQGLK